MGSVQQQSWMGSRYLGDEHEPYACGTTFPDFGSLGLGSEAFQDPRLRSTCDPMNSQDQWAFFTGRPSPDRDTGSNLSLNSASPTSSPAGSPPATHGVPVSARQWSSQGEISPAIVDPQYYYAHEYGHYPAMDGYSYQTADTSKPFVNPSLINPEPSLMASYEPAFPLSTTVYPNSPALTTASPLMRAGSQSPFHPPSHYSFNPVYSHTQVDHRRTSVHSFNSGYSDADDQEKRRCPHPECGKVFKDLKAHMLTHQNERPEKCPIPSCEYHIKGFARKYDKNRHTLTHYKGSMICGFCSGSGTTAEKSFNRADVFKRHLTAVHGVEQNPPNSRKHKNSSSSATAGNGQKPGPGYAEDATGKCSTCTGIFSNAQDFYEHLDDCVLRVVQREDPTEVNNAKRLAEVEDDEDVLATLERNNLPTTTTQASVPWTEVKDEEVDEEAAPYDEADLKALGVKTSASMIKKPTNPANGVQKSRGMTHSRGGVLAKTSQNKGRKIKREYPSSWGFGNVDMKKRVTVCFDGPRRLAKDELLTHTGHEVRVSLNPEEGANGPYITDLDVQTLARSEAFHNATDEEKGPWISDDYAEADLMVMPQ